MLFGMEVTIYCRQAVTNASSAMYCSSWSAEKHEDSSFIKLINSGACPNEKCFCLLEKTINIPTKTWLWCNFQWEEENWTLAHSHFLSPESSPSSLLTLASSKVWWAATRAKKGCGFRTTPLLTKSSPPCLPATFQELLVVMERELLVGIEFQQQDWSTVAVMSLS